MATEPTPEQGYLTIATALAGHMDREDAGELAYEVLDALSAAGYLVVRCDPDLAARLLSRTEQNYGRWCDCSECADLRAAAALLDEGTDGPTRLVDMADEIAEAAGEIPGQMKLPGMEDL